MNKYCDDSGVAAGYKGELLKIASKLLAERMSDIDDDYPKKGGE